MSIQIGDFVTWRSGGPNTIGIRGCKVVAIVNDEVAAIDIGRFAEIEGEAVSVYIKHLEKEGA